MTTKKNKTYLDKSWKRWRQITKRYWKESEDNKNLCQIAKSRRKENGLGTNICLAWLTWWLAWLTWLAGSLAHSLSRPTLSGLVLVSYICFESKWQLTKKLNNVYYKDYIHTQSLVLNFAASLYTSRAALWRARRKLKKLTKLLILTWHRRLM